MQLSSLWNKIGVHVTVSHTLSAILAMMQWESVGQAFVLNVDKDGLSNLMGDLCVYASSSMFSFFRMLMVY